MGDDKYGRTVGNQREFLLKIYKKQLAVFNMLWKNTGKSEGISLVVKKGAESQAEREGRADLIGENLDLKS